MQIKSEKIVLEPIEKLVPNPDNNNRHSIEQLDMLCKMISARGFREPITVSNRSGFIVCGHARLEAAKILKMEKLPVIYQDFENEAEEYAHLTASNEIARWSELDMHMVYNKIEELDLSVELLGIENFKQPEILDPEDLSDKNKEIDTDNFGNDLEHTCPKCGFEFNE